MKEETCAAASAAGLPAASQSAARLGTTRDPDHCLLATPAAAVSTLGVGSTAIQRHTHRLKTIDIADVETAYQRMVKSDVKYRFVIDMASLAGKTAA